MIPKISRRPVPCPLHVLVLSCVLLLAAGGGAQEPSSTVKVAGVVLKWLRGDKEANYRRLEPLVREAAGAGASIVCTTECFLDGYAIADKSISLERYRSLGESIPGGGYFTKLSRLADELDIHLVAGMLEADGEARFNTAVVLAPDGSLIGKYHKQKLGHERPRNTAGSESPVFSTEFGEVGVMICADRRERGIVERLCSNGADFLICPSGGMFGSDRNDPIVQARSRESGRYIVFVHPAEFLVTAPDGSIASRTILGDRLVIDAKDVGTDVDRNRIFYFDLPLSRDVGESPPSLDLRKELAQPILENDRPLRDVQEYAASRVVRLPEFDSLPAWELYAERLRRQVLERVVLRGEAARWRVGERRVEWLETIEGGEGYRIRKLRYEAVPGLWIPALLYEPLELDGKRPVVLNVNGHDGKGKAAVYKQVRSINQAKRGMLALNVEWLGMGQLRSEGFAHYRMNQLDLCGTSGLAPYYLSMERALDILLSREHADPERVAVAGLSGGGWQTIVISALDPRVTLSNPVAGYGSFVTRTQHFEDLGDSEQTPVDLASIADYTHLTALLAPRAALLTYNAEDNCCFRAAHTLPVLLDAAAPIYRLHGREGRLRSHVNHDPGTHNFERENREVLYAVLEKHFLSGEQLDRVEEIPCEAEIKTGEELHVALPSDNADFHTLALDLARQLPRDPSLPDSAVQAALWQSGRRQRLAELLRAKTYHVSAEELATTESERGARVSRWRLKLNEDWTLPAVEIAPPEATHTVVVLADEGRVGAAAAAEEALGEGARVVALDPFYMGESRISQKDFLFALLISSVGDRPLGIQASQISAVCRWLRDRYAGDELRVVARGPRTSLMALVSSALEPAAVSALTVEGTFGSLREVIEGNLAVNKTPELFSFGLLEQFDLLQIAALTAPRPLRIRGASERARKDLAPLGKWYATLGRERDPFE